MSTEKIEDPRRHKSRCASPSRCTSIRIHIYTNKMSVSVQDWEFERELDIFSIGARVYYSTWHKEDPTMTLSQMLQIVAKEREEAEQEEWERHLADEAYYYEEEKRLLKEEEERLRKSPSLETIEESEDEEKEEEDEEED